MTQEELASALETLGMPVAYSAFKESDKYPTPLPFITYQYSSSNDLIADNQNYVEISGFRIELYTKKKDPATEALVQNKLKELRLPYRKNEFWIDSEKMLQVIYEIQLIGG